MSAFDVHEVGEVALLFGRDALPGAEDLPYDLAAVLLVAQPFGVPLSVDPNEAVRLYVDEKWSVRAIAQHFNSSYGKIYGLLRRRVTMRRAGEKSPGDHRHEMVAEILRDRIIAGEWRPGHKILSQEELAKILGVGPQTVNRAIADLGERGYLRTLPSKGTYVRPPLDWETYG